ncbi:NAD-dependent epimerase/dehydratase family protein, partial [Candidatus Woesearchaeota archaeon]|nr:NAD-dependent epimerase/dehydratase family protein [Candidatus Woesearchaeota archaeon]
MSNVLVTGGAGFVGSYIVEQLVEEGYNVRVMDDLRTGNMKNLEKVIDKIEFCQASILDEVKLEQAMRNIETVYHLAAEVGVNRVIGRDQEVWANDYKGTVRVINKALK